MTKAKIPMIPNSTGEYSQPADWIKEALEPLRKLEVNQCVAYPVKLPKPISLLDTPLRHLPTDQADKKLPCLFCRKERRSMSQELKELERIVSARLDPKISFDIPLERLIVHS